MFKKIVLPILVVFLFIANSTAKAEVESYQQYFQSAEYEFGQFDGQTQELLSFEEGGEKFVVEVSANSATELFHVVEPWGELVSIFAFGNPGEDGVTGDFNHDGITDIVICSSVDGNIWFGGTDDFGVFNGTFQDPEPFIPCNGIDAGQIDGQHGDDVIVATDAGVQTFLHDPSNPAIFNYVGVISPTVTFNDVALAPLTGSELDFFAISDSEDLIMEGLGNGTFVSSNQPYMNGGEIQGGSRIIFEDYDIDGNADAFIVSPENGGHAWKGDENGNLHLFVIPNFNHACNSVALGFFDDENGKDIIFGCNDRTWFYTGVLLQDWGQTFTTNVVAVVALDVDGDNDDDMLFGRLEATNLIFKGGPNRVTIDVEQTSYNLEAEVNHYYTDSMNLTMGGNGWRYLNISWTTPWLEVALTDLSLPPEQNGIGFFIEADATGLEPGIHNDIIRILTNDPENEVVLIPVTLVVTAAEVSVIPTTIMETASIVDNSKQVMLTVENTGTASVWVYPSENDDWLTTTGNFKLEPGENAVLIVTLTPTGLQPGVHNSQVTLGNNKSYLENVDIPVEFTITGTQIFLPFATNGG